MKASILASVLAIAIPTIAVSISDLPSCALPCAIKGLSDTSCAEADTACFCKSTTYLDVVQTCVDSACDSSDITKTDEITYEICLAAGVTLTFAASTATSTSSAAAKTSSTATTTATGSSTSSVVDASATSSTTSGSSTTATSSTSATSGTTAESTGAADRLVAGGLMGVAAVTGLLVF